ncbi:MAG: hypothetical protein ACQER4_05985 [Bacteroidota bacterium]
MNFTPTTDETRTVVWRSDWRHQGLFWITGALFLPLFGLGLLFLFWGYLRWRQQVWTVYDRHLVLGNGKEPQNVSLVDLERARVTRSRLERQFGLGTLILETESDQWRLPWLRVADSAADTLNRAIQTMATRKKRKLSRPSAPLSPQQMDRMDELTSLWQQGLISDEDFDQERRHFQSDPSPE